MNFAIFSDVFRLQMGEKYDRQGSRLHLKFNTTAFRALINNASIPKDKAVPKSLADVFGT